jgi:putative spermidine/putrescine transport system substrate-binding protein/spermidine/putrescine transport system substrate-binding protein
MKKWSDVWKSSVIVSYLVMGGLMGLSSATYAAGKVNILTWEGYADDSFVSIFEEQSGCELTKTYVGSNDEIVAKMAAGDRNYDVISPAVNYSQMIVSMNALEAMDPNRLDHFNETFESFRNHPGVQQDGKIYAVPMAWGAIPLMYRTDKFDTPPTSATVLWDPALKGKIAIQDVSMSIYIAARILFGTDKDVYNLNDDELAQVKVKLLEQKALVRDYWSSAGELVDLYAKGEVWVSETWGGYQVALLQEQGIPVAEVIPEEKADGWQDVWNIVKGTPNMDCAYDWVNFISGPQGQCGMVKVAGYSPANPIAVKDCLTAEEQAFHHLQDSEYTKGLDFWQLGSEPDKYVDLWNAVKAAN